MNEEALISAALECGAAKAAVIPLSAVVLNGEFRGLCAANRCGLYGKCYMCPPDVGPVEALMAQIRSFDAALLYQTVYSLEDSFDIEGMGAAKKAFCRVSQRLRDALASSLPEALHLSVGGCGLCPTCGKAAGEPCRHPDRALASLESYGVDVYQTVKNTPLKYVNGPNTVTYFGMVLYGEAGHG